MRRRSSKPMNITIAEIAPGEEQQVLDLVRQVFDIDVAPSYSAEGNNEFYRYLKPDEFLQRSQANHQVFVARGDGGEIVGVLELRDCFHISLLFVRNDLQRTGIGKALIQQAITVAKSAGVISMTVNSSPNAVSGYERFGFRPVSGEQTINGIRFIPMVLTLK
jgi:GNAT superfamily N-acetyltransferase